MNKKLLFFLLIPFLGFSQVQIGQDIDGEAAGDESGHSVSLSVDGKVLAIGDPSNSHGAGKRSGQVRVYQNVFGIWKTIGQRLYGDSMNDRFGYSVALSSDGSIIASGAIGVSGDYLNGTSMSGAGQVRVYQNNNFYSMAWTQIGQDIKGKIIQGKNWWTNESLGRSLALSADGNVLAIGVPNANGDNKNREGNVRIYQNISGVWIQIGDDIKGEAENDAIGNESSVSLSADGKVVSIGAKFNAANGVNSGHVRIYQNVSGIWAQIGDDIDGAPGDLCGSSVSLSADGSIVAIGSPGNNSGYVSIYQNISGMWVQQGNDIIGEAINDRSGSIVSLSSNGTVVAIGAHLNDGKNGFNSGHVRIYQNISGVWIQQGNDIDGEGLGDQSGFSISLSADGNVLAIGAIRNSDNGVNAGHVRVYDISGVLSNDEFISQNFKIYPNPTSDLLNISLENNLVLEQATIYNNLGQVVKTSTENVIDVSPLTKGLYFVEIFTNQGRSVGKMIKK